jgi:hypothetical protein
VTRILRSLRERFDGVTLLALALLAAAIAAHAIAVRPLETRLERLDDRLSADARRYAAESTRSGTPAARLVAFYTYFERPESQVDWLAKLYGSARGAGLDLRAADYRLLDAEGRMARYEVTLPLAGSYAQVRAFLAAVLEENPVLSLDQLSLRRKRSTDSQVEAEAVLTIHLLRS